jgi:hypothetical protein
MNEESVSPLRVLRSNSVASGAGYLILKTNFSTSSKKSDGKGVLPFPHAAEKEKKVYRTKGG